METNHSHKEIVVMRSLKFKIKKRHFDNAIIKLAFPSKQYEHKTYWTESENTSWYVNSMLIIRNKILKNYVAASAALFMDVITDGITEMKRKMKRKCKCKWKGLK